MQDIHTTVCNKNMYFVHATSRLYSQWVWYFGATNQINSICGLGKQKAESSSTGWLSYAVNQGSISKNVYSLEIEPHLAETSASNLHHAFKTRDNGAEEFPTEGHAILPHTRLGKAAYKYNLENVSTLILGGYDETSFTGTLNYYDTSATT